MGISDIIKAIQSSCVRITDHADEEAQNDALSFEEIFFSVIEGKIIKEYSNDKPYPSCLIYGNIAVRQKNQIVFSMYICCPDFITSGRYLRAS